MEDNDRPIDFDRLHLHVTQSCPCPDELLLDKTELMDLVNVRLAEERFQRLLPTGSVFVKEICDFFAKLASMVAQYENEKEKLNVSCWNHCRVTRTQLDRMLDRALEKYMKSYVEPGEAVGAIGAQSISEPGTQMTLKVSKGFRPCCSRTGACLIVRACPSRRFISAVSAP